MIARIVSVMVAALLCGCAAGTSPAGSPPSGAQPLPTFSPGSMPDTIVGGSRVYLDTEVDRPAIVIPTRFFPRYPRDLRASRIQGHVEVMMVVDTTGSVEMSTVHLVTSNHPGFTDSVRDVLPNIRFSPAERGGRPVRSWTRMPFTFTIEPA